MRRTGDWNAVRGLIGSIGNKAKLAQRICLMRWGLKAEGLALSHISRQDLPWEPLSPATIAAKVREGYSENILVETSTYFQNITSWVSGSIALAGVKRTVKDADGNLLANVAATHEFGSVAASIPARPLWFPVMAEAMQWQVTSNSPAKILIELLRR